MRRIVLILAAVLLAAMMLSGCGDTVTARAETVKRVKTEELLPKKSPPPLGYSQKQFDQIKLKLPNKWREKETDEGIAYIDDETHCAYMFSGLAHDKWLSPKQIITQYMSKTKSSPQVVMGVSEVKKDKNGVKYQTAAIKYTGEENGNTNIMMFFFSPDNRLFWIFKGETTEKEHFSILLESLRQVAGTVEFDILNEDKDVITAHTVNVSGLEKYILEFHENGHFLKYENAKEKKEVCTSGTYKVMRGDEAIDYLVSRNEGFRRDELEERIKSECRSFNGLYCVLLHVEEIWRYGYQANSKEYDWMFSGTLGADGKLSMHDHLQFIDLTWTPKE